MSIERFTPIAQCSMRNRIISTFIWMIVNPQDFFSILVINSSIRICHFVSFSNSPSSAFEEKFNDFIWGDLECLRFAEYLVAFYCGMFQTLCLVFIAFYKSYKSIKIMRRDFCSRKFEKLKWSISKHCLEPWHKFEF